MTVTSKKVILERKGYTTPLKWCDLPFGNVEIEINGKSDMDRFEYAFPTLEVNEHRINCAKNIKLYDGDNKVTTYFVLNSEIIFNCSVIMFLILDHIRGRRGSYYEPPTLVDSSWCFRKWIELLVFRAQLYCFY